MILKMIIEWAVFRCSLKIVNVWLIWRGGGEKDFWEGGKKRVERRKVGKNSWEEKEGGGKGFWEDGKKERKRRKEETKSWGEKGG